MSFSVFNYSFERLLTYVYSQIRPVLVTARKKGIKKATNTRINFLRSPLYMVINKPSATNLHPSR